MTKKHKANKFFDRLRHSTTRYDDEQLEILFRFAEKESLLDANVTEIHKRFIEANNGFEQKLECPYGTWHSYDQIDCAKDFDQKGRIHKVTKAFCDQCWERQQRKKLEHRATGVQAMRAEIHRHQERVNQTIKQQRDLIICPKTDVVIPRTQCNNCDLKQQSRCQRVMRDPAYQKELAKIKTLID